MTTFVALIVGYKAAIAKAMTFFLSQFYFQICDCFLGVCMTKLLFFGGLYDEITYFFIF